MKQILSDQDRSRLDRLIAEAEKRTKAQIVLAVIRRSDAYPELPWKAFALGASAAGFSAFVLDSLSTHWPPQVTALIAVAAALGTGAAFALLTVLVPGFARFLLPDHRAGTEVRQYAESMFLGRELFATSGRTGILLLVSLFERKVVLIPDKGLGDRMTADAMRNVIAQMVPFLAAKDVFSGLETGLERLSQVLETAAPGTPGSRGGNELSDFIIEEKGA